MVVVKTNMNSLLSRTCLKTIEKVAMALLASIEILLHHDS